MHKDHGAEPTPNKDNLVWMDLEMTGLDLDKERIIEIVTIITDSDLRIVAVGPNLVVHQPPRFLKAMDEWNRTQHGKSGLTELVKASKITVKEAEKQTLEFIAKYCHAKRSPLCGNSIHHDRRFLIKYMPKLSDYLHYRHVDVTTVRALCERWYPKNKAAPPKKNDQHRALSDLMESIEELRFLRQTYFK